MVSIVDTRLRHHSTNVGHDVPKRCIEHQAVNGSTEALGPNKRGHDNGRRSQRDRRAYTLSDRDGAQLLPTKLQRH